MAGPPQQNLLVSPRKQPQSARSQSPPQSANRPGSGNRLQPGNRPGSPRKVAPRPALHQPGSPRNLGKHAKRIHWDSKAVDNENKSKGEFNKHAAAAHAKKTSGSAAGSWKQLTPAKSPKSNSALKSDTRATRQQAGHTSNPNRRPDPPPAAQHARTPHQRPAGAYPPAKMDPASKAKAPTKRRMVPPAVPDPPRAYRPPPAPRPGRLLSPDLPAIDESMYFVPVYKLFSPLQGRNAPRGRPVIRTPGDQSKLNSELVSDSAKHNS